jgi:hypothetical protein
MINDKLEFEANKFFVEQTLGDSFLMSDEEITNFIEACDFNIHKLRQVLNKNENEAKNTIYGIEIFIKSMGCRLLNVNRAGKLIQSKICD